MKLLGIVFIFCAILLWAAARRWADVVRIRRFCPRGRGGIAWSRYWLAIHLLPGGLAIVGLLLMFAQRIPTSEEMAPVTTPDRASAPAPVFEFYNHHIADPDLDGLRADLSTLGIQFLSKEPSADEVLLPGVLDYPWDETSRSPQEGWRQLCELRERLARRFAQGRNERVIPVRRIVGSKSFRYTPVATTMIIRCTFHCDKPFMEKTAPILTYALDRSAISWQYEVLESPGRSLPSAGVVRYSAATERIHAETLAVILQEMIGLTDIRVAPNAEPLIQGVVVNLSWKANASYLSFVWDTLDRLLADDAEKDLETRKRFSLQAYDRVVAWLNNGREQDRVVYRSADFRKDWIDRNRGPWAFTIDAGVQDGGSSQTECWLDCAPVNGTWIIQRVILDDSVKGHQPQGDKVP